MTRENAVKICREELDKNGLSDWHIRLTADLNPRHGSFLGMCSYKDKCIILNSHHLDIHPDPEIVNTIKHEVAHALTKGHMHDDIWAAKAKELGCTSIAPCSHLSLSEDIIDAIRSGATVEITYETEVIHRPKYQITRLQDKCEVCGKVAKEKTSTLILIPDPHKPDEKWISLECGHLLIKKIPKGTPFQTITFDGDKDCQHEWNGTVCSKCTAKKPYPFQVEGMNFIEQALAINKGAAIFDEMGLGKTIQILGYLKFHPEAFPVLFVVKSAIKFNWAKEILRVLGDMHVPQIIEKSNDWVIPNLKCYIASYDIFVFKTRKSKNGKTINQGFDIQKFIDRGIKTIVLDECQQIKNPDAARTQQVRRLAKEMTVIGASGTPWKNRGSEFFTILNMLAPTKFHSFENFKRRWVSYYEQGEYTKEGGIRNIPAFREYIKDIAIRREVNDVMKELPDTNRQYLYCQLNQMEQTSYDDAENEFVKWYNDLVMSGEEIKASGINILAKLQKLRHLAGLAKIPTTEAFVEQFVEETDKKLVIFVEFKDVGEILYQNLKNKYEPEIPVMKYTSDLSSEERFEIQESFNKYPRVILVASTRAAGEGINLQTCGDAMIHDRQFNPANEDQAAPGRFRRIGSTHKVVNVIFPTASGTADDWLVGIVERKRAFFHEGMNKGEMPAWGEVSSITKEVAEAIVRNWNKKRQKKAG